MRHKALAVAAVLALASFAPGVQADERTGVHGKKVHAGKSHFKHKRATRVRGFQARGGYYSYTDSDVINTYGGSRTLYGSTNFYRDPFVDRQTTAGPFDHGFFFDSGLGPRGGDAPYPR
jgi:hypothetical protein